VSNAEGGRFTDKSATGPTSGVSISYSDLCCLAHNDGSAFHHCQCISEGLTSPWTCSKCHYKCPDGYACAVIWIVSEPTLRNYNTASVGLSLHWYSPSPS
jgi:hypothetical protein